jgi:hypothetical protein
MPVIVPGDPLLVLAFVKHGSLWAQLAARRDDSSLPLIGKGAAPPSPRIGKLDDSSTTRRRC